MTGKKGAFALTELMIALIVIVVFTALVMPLLYADVSEEIRDVRINNIEKKLKLSTEELIAVGHIKGYTSTLDFVKELSNHMNITSYCSGAQLHKCIPYSTINIANKRSIDIKDIKSSSNFGLDADVWGEPVAFTTGDGALFIIMFNRECAVNKANEPLDSQKCIAGIYDWNGNQGPNIFGTVEDEKILPDIISFGKMDLVFNQCSIKLKDGTCFVGTIKKTTPVSKSRCEDMITEGYGIQGCEYDNDYWAGAVLACGGVQNMPSKTQLHDLAKYLYNNPSIPAVGNPSNLNLVSERFAKIGGNTNTFINIWSVENNSQFACRRIFYPNLTAWDCSYPNWYGSSLRNTDPWGGRKYALCVDNSQ